MTPAEKEAEIVKALVGEGGWTKPTPRMLAEILIEVRAIRSACETMACPAIQFPPGGLRATEGNQLPAATV